MRIEARQHSLFFFAHQDDEYFASPWIVHELASGNRVSCLYLTDGASKVSASIRDAESLRVLTSLGVEARSVVFFDNEQRIGDGKLAMNAESAWSSVERWCAANAPLFRIYAPAWEGGHPDHDAAHVIAALTALEHGIIASAWQFSLYHGYRPLPHPLFRVLAPLPSTGAQRIVYYSPRDAWRHANLCWSYPSQLRTWIGLFPEAFIRRAILRREVVRSFEPARMFARPHAGTLLYERLFSVTYDDVRTGLSPLIKSIARTMPE
jgi:LmbE family N-acetylglucosaminyl deacetylase